MKLRMLNAVRQVSQSQVLCWHADTNSVIR
jgi:hypothetical protein